MYADGTMKKILAKWNMADRVEEVGAIRGRPTQGYSQP